MISITLIYDAVTHRILCIIIVESWVSFCASVPISRSFFIDILIKFHWLPILKSWIIRYITRQDILPHLTAATIRGFKFSFNTKISTQSRQIFKGFSYCKGTTMRYFFSSSPYIYDFKLYNLTFLTLET